MRDRFESLVDRLGAGLHDGEAFTASMFAETSSFVRFNRSRIRQPGDVQQADLRVRLIRDGRHATSRLSVGDDGDERRVELAVRRLRDTLPLLPADPHLMWSQRATRTETVQPGEAPDPKQATADIIESAADEDLVGILTSGTVQSGFASSLGQWDWDQRHSVLLDWALYHQGDKAVKSTIGGSTWDRRHFDSRMHAATEQLRALTRPIKTVPPGRHRVWLAPAAVGELLDQVSHGGFSIRAQRTRTTPLMGLTQGKSLHPALQLWEDTDNGLGPAFTGDGFDKPPRVDLVRDGRQADLLVSPRSQKEYDAPQNGADEGEFPMSLSMGTGDLPAAEVLQRLGTGLYITNLWYLNWSDRSKGAITGMTRFACLWVEDGQIVGPTEVMRFDDTVFHLLGTGLEAIGSEAELLPDTGTYGRRAVECQRVPGVLVDGMRFTL